MYCRAEATGADAQQPPRVSHVPRSIKYILHRRKMNEERAAALIQRHYRGYKERRQLAGLGLSASDRWREAIKEC